MSVFSPKSAGLFSCRQIWGGARWIIHVLSLVCLMLLTTSCAWWAVPANQHKTGEFGEDKFLKEERARYQNANTPPQSCLALSGGGIRSAAYSIGVLKGLHLSGKLPKVEIISAVSGGSYAATWLYAQYGIKEQGRSRDVVLDDVLSINSIKEVAEKARTLVFDLGMQGLATVQSTSSDNSYFPKVSMDWITFIPRLIIYGAGVIWSYQPPSSERHETASGTNYENALSNAFHGGKLDVRSNYLKSLLDRLPFVSVRTNTEPPIQDASTKLPYLIVNATIQDVRLSDEAVRDGHAPESISLANRLFEFTPYGMGSPSVGYRKWKELTPEDRAKTYSLSRVASISGAAMDKRTDTYLNIYGRDLGLGYAMLTPTDNNDSTFFFQKKFFVLTDGGHEENLGVYSLIKRNCKEIIVVDAEYDGRPEGMINFFLYMLERLTNKTLVGFEDTYRFEGYAKLQKNLRNEKNSDSEYTRAIDEIDSIVKVDQLISNPSPKNPEELKEREELKEYNGSWDCWSEAVKTRRTRFECKDLRARCVLNGKDNHCGTGEQKQLQMRYIKLSADRTLLDNSTESRETTAKKEYGPRILKFYNKEYDKCGKDEKCKTDARSKDAKAHRDFPHYSTATLAWDQDAFLAIAELGCRAVMREYPEGDSKATLNSDFACINTDRTTGAQEKEEETPRILP